MRATSALSATRLREKISKLENTFSDYKFVRGLAALIEHACAFTSKFYVNPVKVRHLLFAELQRKVSNFA
jgi:predicted nuclease of restriction endonuclease-like RecB superfamily